MTECKREQYEFHALGNREVMGHFDGGDITTDAGGLLLREEEQRDGNHPEVCGVFPRLSRSAIYRVHRGGTGSATDLWTGPGI